MKRTMAAVVAKEGEERCAANRWRGIIRTYEREIDREGRRTTKAWWHTRGRWANAFGTGIAISG